MCIPGEYIKNGVEVDVSPWRPITGYRVVRRTDDGRYGPVWSHTFERFSPVLPSQSEVVPTTGNESGYHVFATRRAAERYHGFRRVHQRVAKVLIWGHVVVCRNKRGNKVGYRSEFMLARSIGGATRTSGFEKLEASK